MANLIRSVLPTPRRNIVYVYPDVMVKQAVELMVGENIGALVVTDDENYLGILSERDVIRSVIHKGLSPEHTKISDAMCADITVLEVTDSVEEAMEVITNTRRHHVLVRENEDIIAIISIGDILYKILDDRAQVIEHLENYIHSY